MTEGEKVLVFPTRLLHSMCGGEAFQGVMFVTQEGDGVRGTTKGRQILQSVLHDTALSYQDRALMEDDPTHKQLIPYCLLKKDGKFFAYKRTKKGGEGRLHDKWSIGIGGHINPSDVRGDDQLAYDFGFFREIYEETGLLFKAFNTCRNTIVGLLNDDSNPVGQVHFGVVHLIEIPSDSVIKSDDPAISEGTFLTLDEIRAVEHKLENWSKLVLNEILAKLPIA